MQRSSFCKLYILMIFFMIFSACSSSQSEKVRKFDLSEEEHVWLEKFFRNFMLQETAIYTLIGSKPLTEIALFYDNKPEELLREEKREERVYFLLNRNDKKDMQFYEKLSPKEKKEKAYLIDEKDFIYPIEDLWDKWEKIQDRFPIKKRFLLVKKEWPKKAFDTWKKLCPECKAAYSVMFVDVLKTAFVIQENYGLFRQAVGYDFDSLEVVFELENKSSNFWDKIGGYEHAALWGLLYGFGKENAWGYTWKGRQIKEMHRTEKEKPWAASIKSKRSCENIPYDDKGAFSLTNFTIPIFMSFVENDPVVAKYEKEKEIIRKLYKGKDFVTFTLELLTDLPEKPVK